MFRSLTIVSAFLVGFSEIPLAEACSFNSYPAIQVFLPVAASTAAFKQITDQNPAAQYKDPEYADPEKFTERPVQIVTGKFVLPGILTLPKGKTDVPLIVLVPDAGPQDKDMTTGANKPLRDLAIGMAVQGVATLRYDNRSKVYGKAIATPGFTVQEEVIDDAVTAIKTGASQPEINKEKIYLLGYGYGGILAPRIAQEAPQLNGVILVATPARPLHDYLLEKKEYELSVAKRANKTDEEALQNLRMQVGNVRNFSLKPTIPADSLPLNYPASYWLDMREYNQGYAARNLPQRILILHPERGYQATGLDMQMWQQGLKHRGKQYTPVLYSDLNHLLQEGKGESTPDEYLQPKNVPMYVMRNIMTWVRFGL